MANEQFTVTKKVVDALYEAAQQKGAPLNDRERNAVYANFPTDAPREKYYPPTFSVALADILAANEEPLKWIAAHPPANTEPHDREHPIRIRKDFRVVYGLQAVLAAKNAGEVTVQVSAASMQEEQSA
jgi:hypothetical protein